MSEKQLNCIITHGFTVIITRMKLDSTDKYILEQLQKDSRISAKQLAQDLKLTATPIYERIKKMERAGIIKDFVAVLDEKKLGLSITAFCNVQLKEHRQDGLVNFEREILGLTEVVNCWHVAGVFDYLLLVKIPDMDSYQDFLKNRLATVENIGQVQSSFVMTKVKDSTALPLDQFV